MANTTYDSIYNVEGLSSRTLIKPKEWWDGAEKVAAEFDKSFFTKFENKIKQRLKPSLSVYVSEPLTKHQQMKETINISQLDARWQTGIKEQCKVGDDVYEPQRMLLSPRFQIDDSIYRIRIHPVFIVEGWMTIAAESFSNKSASIDDTIKYLGEQKLIKEKINEVAEEEYINIVASLFNEKGLSKAEEWDRYNYSVAALGKKQEELPKEDFMKQFNADLETLHDKRTKGGKIKDQWYGDDIESKLRKHKDLKTDLDLGMGIYISHHNMSKEFLTYDAIFSYKSGPDFERMARCLLQHSTVYPKDAPLLQL